MSFRGELEGKHGKARGRNLGERGKAGRGESRGRQKGNNQNISLEQRGKEVESHEGGLWVVS